MALSEHEQKLLEEMERALYAEDPRFASSMREAAPRRALRTGLLSLVVLAGLAAIATGLAIQIPVVSIVGFVVALFGLYAIVSAAMSGGNRATAAPTAAPKKKRTGFLNSAEERFRQRRDGFDR